MIANVDKDGYLICAQKESAQDADYDAVVEAYHAKPTANEGYVYKLRYPELTWEQVKDETEPEIDDNEAFQIIIGGTP